jgi:sulfite exporter TauE/SafE
MTTVRPYDRLNDDGKRVFHRCVAGILGFAITWIIVNCALIACLLTNRIDPAICKVSFGLTSAIALLGIGIFNRRLRRLLNENQADHESPDAELFSN